MRTPFYLTTIALSFFMILPLRASDRTFEKTFSVADGSTLVVSTDVGDVHVGGTSGDQIKVVALLRGNAKDVEEFVVDAKQSAGTVEVTGRMNGKKWFSLGIDELEIRYTITVPGKTNLRIGTSGGDITVEQVAGEISLETSGGDIRSSHAEGKLTMETSGGDIILNEVSGSLGAETSGGDIHVTGAKGAVVLETSGGDIRVGSSDGSVRASTSGGDIIVMLAGNNKGVDVETSGGDIDIMTTGEIKANLDASTSGGSVICSLPVTLEGKIDESHVRGTLNGGGEIIRARTSGGDITIKNK